MYLYLPHHCANGGLQVKDVDFDQSSYLVLESPTIRLDIVICAAYHLTIIIAAITNSFQNTLKAPSKH